MLKIFKKRKYNSDIEILVSPSKRLRGKNRKPLTIIKLKNRLYLTEKIDNTVVKYKPLEVLAYLLANDEKITKIIHNKTICINEQYFDTQDVNLDMLKIRGTQLYKYKN